MILSDLFPAGSLVFDIGAFQGTFTWAALASRASRVIAVEPQPDAVGCLRQMFADEPSVEVIHGAVCDHNGTAELIQCRSMKSASTIVPKWMHGRFEAHTWGDPVKVPAFTLDKLIADYGLPAFVKLDVEGSECAAIAGLSQAVPALSFEFTHEYIDDALACITRLDLLGEYEYAYTMGDAIAGLDYWERMPVFWASLYFEMQQAPPIAWGMVYARLV